MSRCQTLTIPRVDKAKQRRNWGKERTSVPDVFNYGYVPLSHLGNIVMRMGTTRTVNILKFGTPQTIAIIVLKIEKFDETLHLCIQKMLMELQTA